MKKVIYIILSLVLLCLVITNNKDYYVIPNESIRLRIIANSNSIEDQYIKNKVKENIEKELSKELTYFDTINSSRKTIKKNLSKYKDIVKQTLEKENYQKDFKINYGLNYFPKKEYKGVIYEEGDYESLLITLGKGEGNNWWCVMFPPLCTLEVQEQDEIEYRIFIKDFIEKYLSK